MEQVFFVQVSAYFGGLDLISSDHLEFLSGFFVIQELYCSEGVSCNY